MPKLRELVPEMCFHFSTKKGFLGGTENSASEEGDHQTLPLHASLVTREILTTTAGTLNRGIRNSA